VTATTKDGAEIFRESKIYMPQSAIYGRGDFMWSGGAYPGWKAGMLRDTSLQPGQTRTETFEIKYPFVDEEKDGRKARRVTNDTMDIAVRLWYMPTGGDPKQGQPGKTQFLFYETTETVKLKEKENFGG
jgi:hypothetical protein